MSSGTGRGSSVLGSLRPLGMIVMIALSAGAVPADASTCGGVTALQREVVVALADIERSVDPCGESGELIAIVKRFQHCAGARYQICIDSGSEWNFIERGPADAGELQTKITWNPDLSTVLETGCDGDPNKPVSRDPTASLLHELVHAVQDCAGLDPAEHELEAVRVENIYRRAHNLCQRTRYGDQPLPAFMSVPCEPSTCRCGTHADGAAAGSPPSRVAPISRRAQARRVR